MDPGVGSDRPAIAVETSSFIFIGPDNGVLSLALAKEEIEGIYRIENEALFCQPVSSTFHGRDIFAPVAAHLGREASIQDVGPAITNHVCLPFPSVQIQGDLLIGEVIHIDRFGNGITNLPADSVESAAAPRQVVLHDGSICPVGKFYDEVASGAPLALVGSTDCLEIAVNGGRAADQLGMKVGTPVSLKMR